MPLSVPGMKRGCPQQATRRASTTSWRHLRRWLQVLPWDIGDEVIVLVDNDREGIGANAELDGVRPMASHEATLSLIARLALAISVRR